MASPTTLRRRRLRSRRLAFLCALEARGWEVAPATPKRPPPGLEEPTTPCKVPLEKDIVVSLKEQVKELQLFIEKELEEARRGVGVPVEQKVDSKKEGGNILDMTYDELILRGHQGEAVTVECMEEWAAERVVETMQVAVQMGMVKMRSQRVVDWVLSLEGKKVVFPDPEEEEEEEEEEDWEEGEA